MGIRYPFYLYRHVNGEFIIKTGVVVDSLAGGPAEYFSSPFVQMWWRIDKVERIREILAEYNYPLPEEFQEKCDGTVHRTRPIE